MKAKTPTKMYWGTITLLTILGMIFLAGYFDILKAWIAFSIVIIIVAGIIFYMMLSNRYTEKKHQEKIDYDKRFQEALKHRLVTVDEAYPKSSVRDPNWPAEATERVMKRAAEKPSESPNDL